jgi:hypothetical protein
MPWYECPRCGSQEVFFQKGQNFENGIETFKDGAGNTHFRNNLRVSDVNIPYCRNCMVVKMNTYLTQEEIDKRNRNRYLFIAVVIVFLVVFFGNSGGSSNSASVNQSNDNLVENSSSDQSIYASDYNEDGSHEIDRNAMNDGVDDCGNSIPEVVNKIDELIPSTWKLLEFNGCGSGSSYEWINREDDLEMIRIEGHSDVGWCGDLGDNEIESSVKNRILGFGETIQQFSKVEGEEVAHYAYLKTTRDGQNEVIGVIQIGSALDLCGDGDFRIESYLIDSDGEFFQNVVRVAFSGS